MIMALKSILEHLKGKEVICYMKNMGESKNMNLIKRRKREL